MHISRQLEADVEIKLELMNKINDANVPSEILISIQVPFHQKISVKFSVWYNLT